MLQTKGMADKIQKIKANEKILKHKYAKMISVEPQIQLGTSWRPKQKVEEVTRLHPGKAFFSTPTRDRFPHLHASK